MIWCLLLSKKCGYLAFINHNTMNSNNTEALKYKAFYLERLSHQAKSLSERVQQFADAMAWCDKCSMQYDEHILKFSNCECNSDMLGCMRDRFNRAKSEVRMAEAAMDSLERDLVNFKEETELLTPYIIQHCKQ